MFEIEANRKKTKREIWLNRLNWTIIISVIVFILVMAGIGIKTILS